MHLFYWGMPRYSQGYCQEGQRCQSFFSTFNPAPVLVLILLDNSLGPARFEFDSHSPWPCPPILPLNQISSGSGKLETARLHSDIVAIEFAECNKHIALKFLHVLRKLFGSTEKAMNYANFPWTNHLVKVTSSATPQN